MITLPNDNKIDVRLFSNMLDYSTQSASYKPLWLMGILEEVKKGNQEIDFKTIGCHMVSKVWYPVLHCKLSFGHQDSLPKIVMNLEKEIKLKPDEKVDTIFNYLMNMDERKLNSEISILFNMVPYRLLSPFYDTKSGENFNKAIKAATSEDKNAFYKFTDGKKSIVIGDEWVEYIRSNQVIIEAWIEYSMIYYLQKKNPNVPAIPFKLKPPDKRDLGSATKLWKYYGDCTPLKDIYINKTIDTKNIEIYGGMSIDHFLPWSFVIHDEIWNLIPSFKNINSSKNNNLPSLDVYLKDYCNIQYDLFLFIRDYPHQGKWKREMNKLMEEYLHIIPADKGIGSKDVDNQKSYEWYQISADRFKDYLTGTITPLYQIAYNQGYGVWICKDRVSYEETINSNQGLEGIIIAEEDQREIYGKY